MTRTPAQLLLAALLLGSTGCAQVALGVILATSSGGGGGGGGGGAPGGAPTTTAFEVRLSGSSGPAAGGTSLTAEVITPGVALDPAQPIAGSMGGATVLDPRVLSPTVVSFRTPPNPQGNHTRTGSIELRQGSLASTNASFTWQASAPLVAAFSPTSGPESGGTQLTITGSGFVAGSTVTVGGVSATQVLVSSAGQLSCLTPPGTGTQAVVVRHPEGPSGIGADPFRYDPAPPPPPPPPPATSFAFFGQSIPSPDRQAVFVLDRSGSMQLQAPGSYVDEDGNTVFGATLWDRLRSEVIKSLRALPAGFEVNIVVFDECVVSLWPMRRVLTPADLQAAETFLRSLGPQGWTNTSLGTARALTEQSTTTLVLVSDGLPNFIDCALTTVGTEQEHLTIITAANTQRAVIHCAALAVAARPFLMAVAALEGGLYWEPLAPPGGGSGAPAAPTNLVANAVLPTRVALFWTDVATDETGYKVLRALSGTGSFSPLGGTLPPDSTSFTDIGASADTAYDYRVVATNAAGDSLPAQVSVTTPPAGPPPPLPLTVTAIMPCGGLATGGTVVEVRGTGFSAGVTQVLFEGMEAGNLNILADDRLTCTTPAGTPGLADLAVVTASGRVDLSQAFIYGTTVRTTDFSTNALPSWLEDPQSGFAVSGGMVRRTNAGGLFDRAYLRTTDDDWITRDFVFEATFANATSNLEILFFGLGAGAPDPTTTNEPLDGVFLRVHTSGFEAGRVDGTVSGNGGTIGQTIGATMSGGPHRLRIVKRGALLTLAVDASFTGVFVPDMSYTVDRLGTIAPFLGPLDTRIFFGAERNEAWFDDLCLAELPAAALQVVRCVPAAGPPAGGVPITVEGSGFLGGAQLVTFGGLGGPTVPATVVDDRTLTCTLPPGGAGETVDVQVDDVQGRAASAAGAFTYTGPFFVFDPTRRIDLDPNLEDPDGAFDLSNGLLRAGLGNSRHYVRTRLDDYVTRDFTYEHAFQLGGNGSVNIVFVGLGTGVNDGSGEPGNSVHFRIHPPDVVGGRVDVAVAGGTGGASAIGFLTSEGPHRARVTKSGDTLLYEIDANSVPGAPFVADMSHSIPSIAVNAPFLSSGPSRLFFGATFDSARFLRAEVR